MKNHGIDWTLATPGAESITQMTQAGMKSYWLAKLTTSNGLEIMIADEGKPLEFVAYDDAVAKAEQAKMELILSGQR